MPARSRIPRLTLSRIATLSSGELERLHARDAEETHPCPMPAPGSTSSPASGSTTSALGPGDLAEYILLPGDQDRVELVASHFDERRAAPPPPRVRHRHRQVSRPARLVRVDGHRHRQRRDRARRDPRRSRTSRRSSGSGRAGRCSRAWRSATSSSRPGSVRLETTTSWFVHDGYPAVAHYEAVLALEEAATRARPSPPHGPDRHGARLLRRAGTRRSRTFPSVTLTSRKRWPDRASSTSRWRRPHSSCWPAWAAVVPASCAPCTPTAGPGSSPRATPRIKAEAAVVETGLESLLVLAELDRQKQLAGAARWRPSLWSPG